MISGSDEAAMKLALADARNRLAELGLVERVAGGDVRLHRLLAAVSNNVNQIAKATNATGQRQAETDATLAAVRRVAERIDAAVDELSLS